MLAQPATSAADAETRMARHDAQEGAAESHDSGSTGARVRFPLGFTMTIGSSCCRVGSILNLREDLIGKPTQDG